MAGAQAGPVIAVKVLVKLNVVGEVRVGIQRRLSRHSLRRIRGGRVDRAVAPVIPEDDPAKPAGAMARTVRAQRSSCRHRSARLGSKTRASTM